MHFVFRLATLGSLLIGLSACATLVEGTSENVSVTTDPSGATCTLDTPSKRAGAIATTPGSVRLDRSKDDLKIVCHKDGFADATLTNSSHMVATTAGNIIAGGVIGLAVDAASGANFTYYDDVRIGLDPASTALPQGYARRFCPADKVNAARSDFT